MGILNPLPAPLEGLMLFLFLDGRQADRQLSLQADRQVSLQEEGLLVDQLRWQTGSPLLIVLHLLFFLMKEQRVTSLLLTPAANLTAAEKVSQQETKKRTVVVLHEAGEKRGAQRTWRASSHSLVGTNFSNWECSSRSKNQWSRQVLALGQQEEI